MVVDIEDYVPLDVDSESDTAIRISIDLGEVRFNLRDIGADFKNEHNGNWKGGFTIEVSEDDSTYYGMLPPPLWTRLTIPATLRMNLSMTVRMRSTIPRKRRRIAMRTVMTGDIGDDEDKEALPL